MIEVLRPGPLATVQDLGRPGLAHLGVGVSGAADRGSLQLANRLVGNPPGAAALEATLGGLAVRFEVAATVACTGAPCPLRVGGRAAGIRASFAVPAGAVLELGAPPEGLRSYLAVAGGIDVPPVLGSRSTDTLAGLGPAPLRAGDRLPLGPVPRGAQPPGLGDRIDVAPQPRYGDEVRLRVVPGPRDDWFDPGALGVLTSTPYTVTPQCDRVGMRLEGAELVRRERRELPPEGMVTGALQVPPAGGPILFLADHPVTGGYPVIGVVVDADVPLAAQARPGTVLRFDAASGPR